MLIYFSANMINDTHSEIWVGVKGLSRNWKRTYTFEGKAEYFKVPSKYALIDTGSDYGNKIKIKNHIFETSYTEESRIEYKCNSYSSYCLKCNIE